VRRVGRPCIGVSSLTAMGSPVGLAADERPILYTQLQNPTSNGVYRISY
jgi:predicted GNAT family acetyltransferase